LAQTTSSGFGLGEGDLVFRLAISRVAKNLEQKTMSLSYRETDYFFHRKSEWILIFGLDKNSLNKAEIRRVFNVLLEDTNFELLLKRADLTFKTIREELDDFVAIISDALHYEVKYQNRTSSPTSSPEIGNIGLR
jgi:hypothetical protein